MKTYIVSGCSSGIGKSTCSILLKNGFKVIGISKKNLNPFPENKNFSNIHIDLTKVKDIEKPIQSILSLNKSTLNGYIACAGKGLFGNIEQLATQDILNTISLNLLSHVVICKLLIPYLKKSKSGKIIFIGSEAALQGAQKGSIYCASKFALRGFAQSIKEECRKSNITVSIINPGAVKTPFFDNLDFTHGENPSNFIDAQEIANTIFHIISSKHFCIYEEINLSPIKKVINKKK